MPGKMPSTGASVASGNRMSAMEAAEAAELDRQMGKPKPKAPAKAPTKKPAKVLTSSGTGYGSFKK